MWARRRGLDDHVGIPIGAVRHGTIGSNFLCGMFNLEPEGHRVRRTCVDKGGRVHDQFDVTLEDGDLLGEVELTTTLIIAASECEGRLSAEEIDELLGVTPVSEQRS